MAAITVDFFQNIGMLKLDFCLHPSTIPINNFFYSVYGNSGFTLKGAFDISSLRKRESVPSLFFRTGINNNYFIKVKYLLNGEEKEHFKIIDLTRLHRKENINMNILDKSIEDLFKSINLEEEDDEEDEESDNGNDYNESNGNESNDNESNDNESNDNGNGNESNDNESNDNGSNYNELDINSLQMKSITFNRERSVSENTEDN